MTAHHAGADQADAQWLVHGHTVPIMAGSQHALALLSIISRWMRQNEPELRQIIRH
jgi:hypothetical protein